MQLQISSLKVAVSHRISPTPSAHFWKTLATHLLIPLFLAGGMALAYLGAFHQPQPHDLKVAIVGNSAQSMVFAQTVGDKAVGALDVQTVPDEQTAIALVTDRSIAAAYETDATHATLIVASAASDTTAAAAQKIFLPIAYQQNLPLQLDDVVSVSDGDSTGQGLFFLLVALSVGGYASAVTIAALTGGISVRWRLAISAAVAAVIAAIGIIVAGPIYHVLGSNALGVGLFAWLYDFGIIAIGVGLHPILRKWTTPVLTMLFVMLNFTSSGGIFAAPFQPAFFAGLNTFWNGAAWLNAAQTLTYFPGQGFGFAALRLALWAGVGVALILLTHLWSIRRTAVADETALVTQEEQEQSAIAA
ncbi:hypothetical protein [Subtercola lobariae]|uniref:Membrane protein n=1 Tax=Subtercola lobariae TaxID=1588641 RepID=A0A917B3R1_9MICO|nr:hypothetical protein [Subtercola lobariae]GGF17633.1 membrane protein [Subtercola lobariae]